jgi:hypothetical protein
MIAIYMTGLATILLLAIPFIPGLRDIPRLIPVHRLVWRSYYHSGPAAQPGPGPQPGPGSGSDAGTDAAPDSRPDAAGDSAAESQDVLP